LKVPKGKSLMAGSEDDVRIFGVKAVFVDEVAGVEGLLLSLDLEVLCSPALAPSLAGVLRSETVGDALGDAALWLLAHLPLVLPESVLLEVEGVLTRLPVDAELDRSSGERDFSLGKQLFEDL
jgi:hypothetical protein